MIIEQPYVLFLGDVPDQLAAKTAMGIVDWRREQCIGQVRLEGCEADTGLDDIDFAEAVRRGAKTCVIGVVNAGGVLPEHWISSLVEAIDAGLNLASGLHKKLEETAEIRDAAQSKGVKLHNVRHGEQTFPTGKGHKRTGKRILTVGTDCSIGKKYTALALDRDMRAVGMKSDFCATGQTGIFISGRGVSIDAVVADFISGAVETISPGHEEDKWDCVEGQGSLFHPSFAGVSMGLLHGSQPDAFVICHEPTRTKMRGVETPLPTIQQVIDMTIACGRLTNPDIRPVGISVNTSALNEDEAMAYLAKLETEYGLPTVDSVRTGTHRIVQNIRDIYGM